ncbi:MAG: hypothetical protein WD851_10745 [Pirellulales bacterium]
MKHVLILTATLTTCGYCAAQEAAVEKLIAQSEAPIQERISNIVDALSQSRVDPRRNLAALREANLLIESVADRGEIVKQVAIFAASPASREGRPFEAQVILEVLDLPPKIVIRVLAPYVNSENLQLRSFVRNWLESHDTCGGSGGSSFESLNYQIYLDYVRVNLNMSEEVPPALVEFMYERSPERALMVFHHANPQRHAETVAKLREMQEELEADRQQLDDEGASETPQQRKTDREKEIRQKVESELRREVLMAEHIVSNAIWLKENKFGEEFQKALPEAKAQLWKLSERDEWWARLYVAEIMRKHRELRQPLVIQRLSADENALVSEKARSVKQ